MIWHATCPFLLQNTIYSKLVMVNTVKEKEAQPCQQRERSGLGNPKADKIVLRKGGPRGRGLTHTQPAAQLGRGGGQHPGQSSRPPPERGDRASVFTPVTTLFIDV